MNVKLKKDLATGEKAGNTVKIDSADYEIIMPKKSIKNVTIQNQVLTPDDFDLID